MRKYLIIILTSALFLIFLYFYQKSTLEDNRLHLVICDVGQGDGIYIRTPKGADIVIDGGPQNGKMVECLSEHMPFWDHSIEVMFATHPDADHIGGLIDVLDSYAVKSFNTSTQDNLNKTRLFETLKRKVSEEGIVFVTIATGDRFKSSDGVNIQTLWPKEGFEATDTNSYSLVQILKYGKFRALLTGDIPYPILNNLVVNESFNVFKIPHHGSKTGVDAQTFNQIHADFVPISDGYRNRYHHPSASVLELLKEYKVPYERTDQKGTIEIVTDGVSTRIVN